MRRSDDHSRHIPVYRRAVRYSFLLALLICLIVGLYLIWADSASPWRSKLPDLGVNLVAAVVFAAVFSFLSERERDAFIVEQVRETMERSSLAAQRQWRSAQRLYIPARHYPPSEGFDQSFNRELMSSIAASSAYYFQGVTAKYLPVRLAVARQCPTSVHLIVPHPTSGAVNRRVADRMKNPKYSGRTAEQLRQEIQGEILESLVALFDCRHMATINIVLAPETAVTRIELTDRSAFVTWYHGADSLGRSFAETLRFDPDSFYYQVMRLDLLRTFELSDPAQRITCNYNTTERQWRGILGQLFSRPVKDISLPDLREAHHSRMQGFVKFLQELN